MSISSFFERNKKPPYTGDLSSFRLPSMTAEAGDGRWGPPWESAIVATEPQELVELAVGDVGVAERDHLARGGEDGGSSLREVAVEPGRLGDCLPTQGLGVVGIAVVDHHVVHEDRILEGSDVEDVLAIELEAAVTTAARASNEGDLGFGVEQTARLGGSVQKNGHRDFSSWDWGTIASTLTNLKFKAVRELPDTTIYHKLIGLSIQNTTHF